MTWNWGLLTFISSQVISHSRRRQCKHCNSKWNRTNTVYPSTQLTMSSLSRPSHVRRSNSQPFNPAHTHPASIQTSHSFVPKRIHGSTTATTAQNQTPNSRSVPEEGIQSGGGGGGGTGLGSSEAMLVPRSSAPSSSTAARGGTRGLAVSDVRYFHPAWEGFGKSVREEVYKAKL